MKSRHICFAVSALAAVLGATLLPSAGRAEAGSESSPREVESCIGCHADPDFLVTHPKLYEYYREWEHSIHGQEEVTCSDCHGGDSDTSDANAAHAEFADEKKTENAVGFSKVHETCGVCHDEILDAYSESTHYTKLKEKEQGERHGPTCVTCHQSMNTLTLDVTTVEAACARCHNEETEIAPEVPQKARAAINKFLSIDRFRRYVAARMEPAQSGLFFRQIDDRVSALSALWHTFDLPRIESETQAVLDVMRQKRDEIRKQKAAGD